MELTGIAGGRFVVTGAAQGIGEGVARRLADGGARLVLIDRQQAEVEHIAKDVGGIALAADVADAASVDAAVDDAAARLGAIDGLVNVAGIQRLGALVEQTPEDFDAHFAVNLRGAWLAARAAARHMMPRGAGAIVTVSSNAARVPRVRQGAYCASKAGVSHLMRVLALELGPAGIRVNTVAPGATETAMIRRMMDEMGFGDAMVHGDMANFRVGVPLGGIAQIGDVADAVAFLLSDMARHVTMHELVVDGGSALGA